MNEKKKNLKQSIYKKHVACKFQYIPTVHSKMDWT